ncbi:glycine amidinotransferase [Streptomyces rectiverticillatus]|uniref:glycine amidinotransferase n=1 Tax=Streptomyces rectiverticillatus TaxID=173860 RepID=UPI0015C370B9|nr:glycine amidinotransferase [Streptomyces rectiverticillatus]QLE75785.1 glycine amidinotransferase [Streptomyces rectiverticillatus]
MSVSSYDEWSPLREVIVGSPAGYDGHELDLSFRLFFKVFDEFTDRRHVAIRQQYVEELCEDVEELVKALESVSVTVRRPLPRSASVCVRTPHWKATPTPALNVRDQAIVLGDEIIETPPQVRARYFENDLLKPVFAGYFARGARWTVMPRPVMTDQSFDLARARAKDPDHVPSIGQPDHSDTGMGIEMMFDGAQCLRFGRDVVVNVATEHHALGAQWLQRHFGERFRFHVMHRLDNNHIDTQVLPLRPGTLLLRSRQVIEHLPEPLRRWDHIYAPEPDPLEFPDYCPEDLTLTGLYIDMNVLSIDDRTVIANSEAPRLVRILENHGFTVIPVRHRHRRLFGGGFHCFTLDTVRAGSGPEDYFS